MASRFQDRGTHTENSHATPPDSLDRADLERNRRETGDSQRSVNGQAALAVGPAPIHYLPARTGVRARSRRPQNDPQAPDAEADRRGVAGKVQVAGECEQRARHRGGDGFRRRQTLVRKLPPSSCRHQVASGT